MNARGNRHRGLTLIEVLLLIGIFACVCIMLWPALLAARESARRPICVENMKKLGVAFHQYSTAFPRQIVASSNVSRDRDGKITAVDGWSWLALTLPYMESWKQPDGVAMSPKDLYDTLDITNGRPLIEPKGAEGTPHADALATSMPYLLCPSSGSSPYTDFEGKKAAVTSYHPLGATHIESLSIASANPLTPKYNPGPWPGLDMSTSGPPHPDGNCFPGVSLLYASLRNGLSNTLLLVESLEPRYARWTVGADAALVAFPRCVEFEEYRSRRYAPKGSAYAPKGYSKALEQSAEADSTYWTYHTYLDWDYSRSPYDAADGTSGERYGPSSNHPGVVNHVIMDGSVRSLSKDIDITLYMFLVRGRFSDY
jgi:hypothetical protein